MSTIFNNQTWINTTSFFYLKNIKTGFGHDLQGLYCDIYIWSNGKKIGYLNDDGWGGEAEIHFTNNETEKQFNEFLVNNNIAQLMFDNGWDFYDNGIKDITNHNMQSFVIEKMVEHKERNKFLAKRNLLLNKAIVYGNDNQYSYISFKIPFTEFIEQFGKAGINSIQKEYNKIKNKLKPGNLIFNKNLEKLGIKL